MDKAKTFFYRFACLSIMFLSYKLNAADLLSSYHSALKNDPEYRSAIHGNLAIKEGKNQARALFLPQASINAYTRKNKLDNNSLDLSYDTSGYNISATQPIYNRANRHIFNQSGYAIEQSNAKLAQAKSSLLTRTADAYFGVLEAKDVVELSKAELKAIKTQLGDIRQQYDVGLVNITDVHEAKAGFDRATSQKLIAETNLDIAKAGLRQITGLETGKLKKLKANFKLEKPLPANIKHWQDLAGKNSNSIKASRMAAEIAREEISKQRAGHYPKLDLTANYGRNNTELPTSSDATGGTIGLELTIPLYQGGRVSSATREAKHRFDAASQNLVEIRRLTDNQVRTFYLNILSDIKQVSAAKQLVRASQSALDAAIAGFEAGTRTTIDVLNSRRELFSAKLTLAQARYKYVLDHLRLKDAAGILSDKDAKEINKLLQ